MKAYKIRHPVTGLFKLGGRWGGWGYAGKTWAELKHLRAHLTMVRGEWNAKDIDTWEIVEYELTEQENNIRKDAKR